MDFYVPSLDLFIELNAHPSHGKAPYKLGENTNITGSWLDTYVRRDPEKLKIAKKNKLNYIMVYPANTLKNNLKLNKK